MTPQECHLSRIIDTWEEKYISQSHEMHKLELAYKEREECHKAAKKRMTQIQSAHKKDTADFEKVLSALKTETQGWENRYRSTTEELDACKAKIDRLSSQRPGVSEEAIERLLESNRRTAETIQLLQSKAFDLSVETNGTLKGL